MFSQVSHPQEPLPNHVPWRRSAGSGLSQAHQQEELGRKLSRFTPVSLSSTSPIRRTSLHFRCEMQSCLCHVSFWESEKSDLRLDHFPDHLPWLPGLTTPMLELFFPFSIWGKFLWNNLEFEFKTLNIYSVWLTLNNLINCAFNFVVTLHTHHRNKKKSIFWLIALFTAVGMCQYENIFLLFSNAANM